jgi:hypothetical protein
MKLYCTSCSYKLTGLCAEGDCPQCGFPIQDSFDVHTSPALAIASLMIGIISLASWLGSAAPSLALGPIAIIIGVIALCQSRKGNCSSSIKLFALIGLICGFISFGIFWAIFFYSMTNWN